MPTIDLMPRSCREAIIRRVWTRRWVCVYLVVLLSMIAMHWGLTSRHEARRSTLAGMTLQVEENLRRNKERINRDAERELISIEWELGLPDDDEA